MVFLLRRSGFQNADEHSPAVTFRLCIRQDLNLQLSDPKILDEVWMKNSVSSPMNGRITPHGEGPARGVM